MSGVGTKSYDFLLKSKFFFYSLICVSFSFSKLVQIGTMVLICIVWIYTTPRQKRDSNGVFLNSHRKVRSRIALTNHFRTQLAHFQVFSRDLPHFVSANGKLLRNHSHSQSTIYTHQLLHSINVDIGPACHWPARSLIFLTFFMTFSESFVLLKSRSS